MPAPRSRNWCFTWNNYPVDYVETLKSLSAKYVAWSEEVAPTTGTQHLQGFLCSKSPITLSALKKFLPHCHLEPMKGSLTSNEKYCSKQSELNEIGTRPLEPKDGGLLEKQRHEDARTAAKEGRFDDIPADLYNRYMGNFHRMYSMHRPVPPSVDKLDFHWFYGPSGTGKSLAARNENPGYYLKRRNKWWDNYTDQPCVIIEEWCPQDEQYLGSMLKEWCDHHPFAAEMKGSTVTIRPPKIIITSNYSLEECFSDIHNLEPLRRRLTIRQFT